MAAEVSAELTLELSRFRRNARQVIQTFDGMRKNLAGTGRAVSGSMFDGIKSAAARAARGVATVFKGVTMGVGLAIGNQMMRGIMGALAPIRNQIGAMFSGAVADEKLSVAFETLVGGAKLAAETIKDLKVLGASTPFQFLDDIAPAGRSLIAFGESAKDVVKVLRRVGDVSAGVDAPLRQIAEIYGKARVQGTLFAEDINQLTGRGIPIIQEFAKQLGVTDGEVKKLASQGKVGFPLLERAFIDLTSKGGKFYQMMQKQSLTTGGLISTLKDNWTEVLINFGRPIQDALKPLLSQAIVLVGEMREKSVNLGKALGEKIGGAVQKILPMFEKMNTLIPAFGKMLGSMNWGDLRELVTLAMTSAFKRAINVLGKGVQAVLAAAVTNLLVSLQQLPEVFAHITKPAFWEGIGKLMKSIGATLGAAIMSSLSTAMDALSAFAPKIFGKRAAAGKKALQEGIAGQESAAKKDSAEGSGTLELMMKLARERMKAVGGSLASGFKDGKNIFSTEKEDKRIKEIVGGMKNNLTASKAAVEAANNARRISSDRAARRAKARDSGKPEEPGAPAPLGGSSPALANSRGAFAREIGALYGRSPQEALAAEAKQQTNILKTIAENTKPAANNRPPVGNAIASFS